MPQLKDRNRQIPGGFKFYVAEVKWNPSEMASKASFSMTVQEIISMRQGHKRLTEKNNWSTDYETVANELDAYNAKICKDMKWDNYIMEGANESPPPKSWLLSPKRGLKNVAAGAKILVEWISSGAEAVPIEQAEARAKICASCPKNGKGDWTHYFTQPVSEAIRSEVERKNNMNLRTSRDDELHVCTACGCPLPLKVFVPISNVLSRLTEESKSELDPNCWILSEQK